MMDKTMEQDSKYLSYLLRHKPDEVGCTIDKHGWVDIHTLCKNSKFTLSYLETIVSEDTRYEFSQDMTKIRAFHGHSVEGVEADTEMFPKHHIYHGTSVKNYELIKQSGMIKKMSRNYVYLSDDAEKAKKIGARHGKPIVLIVSAEEMVRDGFKFYDSGDDVILTQDIPLKYVVDTIEF